MSESSHGHASRPAGGAGGGEPSGGEDLRLELPAVHAAARAMRQIVREFARNGGMAGAELNRLLLIFDELLSNAIDHGGGSAASERSEQGSTAKVQISLHIDPCNWTLRVGDEGPGDAEDLRRRLRARSEVPAENERGRGLVLLVELADAVEVRRRRQGPGLVIGARRCWRRTGR